MEDLLTEYEKPVFNAAFRMLGNSDDAADITQNVFLKAFENIRSFNPGHRFFSWIYRIAINESIDQLKRRDRAQWVDEEIIDDGPAPQKCAADSEVAEKIQSAMLSLNDNHRAVIVLHYFCECDYRQISETLDIAEKTVKSRLCSARRLLKRQLAHHGLKPS
ncbi:MAG: sigma-70 family RNA polymerase sigma factor [Gammaproteobacteria bacterium]|nr:sigma-70 family RNA polymerase sigma factor [Gammaproteobacteria bacterium]